MEHVVNIWFSLILFIIFDLICLLYISWLCSTRLKIFAHPISPFSSKHSSRYDVILYIIFSIVTSNDYVREESLLLLYAKNLNNVSKEIRHLFLVKNKRTENWEEYKKLQIFFFISDYITDIFHCQKNWSNIFNQNERKKIVKKTFLP